MAGGRKAQKDRRSSDRAARVREVTIGYRCFQQGRDAKRFEELATGAKVEVLEVKRSLDRYVLGQVIIGADLLELEYAPSKINQVVICNQDDPVLKLVCDKRGIRVWMPPRR
jgi:hypothetical protein